jgi:DNA processing protein
MKVPIRIKSWLLLSKISFPEVKKIHHLLEHLGSVEDLLFTPLEKLSNIPKIDREVINFIRERLPQEDLTREYWLIKKLGVRLIPWSDPLYPLNLSYIYDPPFLLYVKGSLEKEDEKAVAVVGTRRATVYGKIVARRLARELAREGITVVSGMARGIDTAAHEGALEEGGRTIAVLGCGVDLVYPPENSSLAEEIIKKGAVISEFPLGTRPFAHNFPRRNRIISGLSRGVVVVEAPYKSGALITADCALEQGREVFAIPGTITSPCSRGTNRLIKEGAKIVEDVSDILEELNLVSLKEDEPGIELQLSFEEKSVLDYLSSEPSHIDEVVKKTRLPVAKVGDILMRLQLKGMVRELPGKLFIREV